MNKTGHSRSSALFTAFTLVLLAFTSSQALAGGLGNPKQFMVEMKMTAVAGEDAGLVAGMKCFAGDDRLRCEMSADGMPGGAVHITVHDGDEVTSYMLIPQMNMYMKNMGGAGGMMEEDEDDGPILTFGSPTDADHPCKADPDVSCKKVGSETFIGRSVDKYVVTEVEDGVPTESTMWFDRELLFPVKIEDNEGVMEAISIEVGKQPASLFEIPAGYREMAM